MARPKILGEYFMFFIDGNEIYLPSHPYFPAQIKMHQKRTVNKIIQSFFIHITNF